jgi:ATP-dependent exoDNAse (exonuclease V) beta subunit
MPDPNYDPVKAHQYYEDHKHLKGRRKGQAHPPPQQHHRQPDAAAQQKVAQIQAKLARLHELLNKKIASSHASKKDKPKTAADKLKQAQQNKDYYKKHREKIKAAHKKASGTGGGSSGGSYESMSVDELRTAIRRTVVQLKEAIAKARGG